MLCRKCGKVYNSGSCPVCGAGAAQAPTAQPVFKPQQQAQQAARQSRQKLQSQPVFGQQPKQNLQSQPVFSQQPQQTYQQSQPQTYNQPAFQQPQPAAAPGGYHSAPARTVNPKLFIIICAAAAVLIILLVILLRPMSSKIRGTWELDKATYQGETQYASQQGMSMTFTFNKGGVLNVSLNGDTNTCKYSVTGKNLTIYDPSYKDYVGRGDTNSVSLTIDKCSFGTLVLVDHDGVKYHFKKR